MSCSLKYFEMRASAWGMGGKKECTNVHKCTQMYTNVHPMFWNADKKRTFSLILQRGMKGYSETFSKGYEVKRLYVSQI